MFQDPILSTVASIQCWLFTKPTGVGNNVIAGFNFSWAANFIGTFKLVQIPTAPVAAGSGAAFQYMANSGYEGINVFANDLPATNQLYFFFTTDTAFTTSILNGAINVNFIYQQLQ
jgi:hypothetical protein